MFAASLVLAVFWGPTLVAADCQKTTAIETLDLSSLEGKWYQLSSFGTLFIHGLDRCQAATITAGSDGKSFVMAIDRIARLLNIHIKYNWYVEANGEKISGDLVLKVNLPIFGPVTMPLHVLDTDYRNYMVLYVCREFASIFKFNAGFIFTRKRQYHANDLDTIYASVNKILKKNGIPPSMFYSSIQTDCEDKSSSTFIPSSATLTGPKSNGGGQTTVSVPSSTAVVEEKKTSETPSPTLTGTTSNAGGPTTVSVPSVTGLVGEKKTPETPSVSESATADATSQDKITSEHSEKKTPETPSVSESTTVDAMPQGKITTEHSEKKTSESEKTTSTMENSVTI